MQRTSDPSLIEARLLELAHTTQVKLTAPVLAYYAPCAIEDAAKVLDNLAAKNILSMEIDDNGAISYELIGRQQLPAAIAAPPPPTLALVPRTAPRPSALLAALITLWLPGAGHLYAGRVTAAIVWFLAVGAGYALILPGLILHLFCIVSAASAARMVGAPVRYQLPRATAA